MITAFFIFDAKGEVLISRLCKEGVKRSISDVFRIQVISNLDVRSPVLTLGSTSFLYIKNANLWFVAVTRSNSDASIVFEFLNKLNDLLTNCFGDLDSNAIKANFMLIYEILDEVLDFGYPQNMELESLKEVLGPRLVVKGNAAKESSGSKFLGIHTNSSTSSLSRSNTTLGTSTISWRRPGIKYRRNEIFLDVHENINLLMGSNGNVLRSYVEGSIQMKTHLSGMPECKFGLNDSLVADVHDDPLAHYDVKNKKAIPKAAAGAVSLEDCKFHQCVQLDKFVNDRLIQFIPPDGEFQLMSYRAVENVNLPFQVFPTVNEVGKSKVQYQIRVRSLFPNKLFATDVKIRIPTPKSTIKTYISSTSGKAKFHPEESHILWKFNKFVGQSEHTFTAEVELAEDPGHSNNLLTWSRPPINMDFNLLMFSCSGIVVRFLKIQEKSGYATVKWVKYIAKAGSYEIRY